MTATITPSTDLTPKTIAASELELKTDGYCTTNTSRNLFYCNSPERLETGYAQLADDGKYFAKERNPNVKRFHLNLYAIDQDGNEIMMTKDHIIPVSKGGKDMLENYQTMCMKCNVAKGNKMV